MEFLSTALLTHSLTLPYSSGRLNSTDGVGIADFTDSVGIVLNLPFYSTVFSRKVFYQVK